MILIGFRRLYYIYDKTGFSFFDICGELSIECTFSQIVGWGRECYSRIFITENFKCDLSKKKDTWE